MSVLLAIALAIVFALFIVVTGCTMIDVAFVALEPRD